jgi:hypothetical protein
MGGTRWESSSQNRLNSEQNMTKRNWPERAGRGLSTPVIHPIPVFCQQIGLRRWAGSSRGSLAPPRIAVRQTARRHVLGEALYRPKLKLVQIERL